MCEKFWLGYLQGRDRLEDNKGTEWEGVDWTHLAEDRDQWRTLVIMVMNLQVKKNAENFLTS
jgi:hypothetical protein